eukprot:scaffold125023_cov39-Phaeocystis_antarctica.AAC.1
MLAASPYFSMISAGVRPYLLRARARVRGRDRVRVMARARVRVGVRDRVGSGVRPYQSPRPTSHRCIAV